MVTSFSECPEGSCKLLRSFMSVGVLKRAQILSESKTAWALSAFSKKDLFQKPTYFQT